MILVNSLKFLVLVGAISSLSLISSCNKGAPKKELTPLEARGKGVFVSNCIVCHNPNPTIDGSIGPAIANSSLELITHRVLTRDYPPGYKPKRNSEAMPDFPQLKDDVPALHAYLNSFNSK
jgi:mono/diheme cytochrome c family protein